MPPSNLKRIRDLERLLQKKVNSGVADEELQSIRSRIEELRGSQAENVFRDRKREHKRRYHMVKFFERKKVIRALAHVLKNISDAKDEKTKKNLLLKKDQLTDDLTYVLYYPVEQKYVALFAGSEDMAENEDVDAMLEAAKDGYEDKRSVLDEKSQRLHDNARKIARVSRVLAKETALNAASAENEDDSADSGVEEAEEGKVSRGGDRVLRALCSDLKARAKKLSVEENCGYLTVPVDEELLATFRNSIAAKVLANPARPSKTEGRKIAEAKRLADAAAGVEPTLSKKKKAKTPKAPKAQKSQAMKSAPADGVWSDASDSDSEDEKEIKMEMKKKEKEQDAAPSAKKARVEPVVGGDGFFLEEASPADLIPVKDEDNDVSRGYHAAKSFADRKKFAGARKHVSREFNERQRERGFGGDRSSGYGGRGGGYGDRGGGGRGRGRGGRQ